MTDDDGCWPAATSYVVTAASQRTYATDEMSASPYRQAMVTKSSTTDKPPFATATPMTSDGHGGQLTGVIVDPVARPTPASA